MKKVLNDSVKRDVEILLACGGLLRIEEKSAGNQQIHLLRPAYIAGDEILCDYSVFDRCAAPGALIDEKSLLVPDVKFDGVCWEKVLAAAQVLIYGVSDVNDSNALTKGWINFALGRNVFPEAEPIQTERYLRTQPKTHGEAIRSRVWLTLKATKAHVSMNDVQAALDYDRSFYSGDISESLYCWRESDALELRDDVRNFLSGLKEGLRAEDSRHHGQISSEYVNGVICRMEQQVGGPLISGLFYDESLTDPDNRTYIAAWHLANGIASLAESQDAVDAAETMTATMTALGNEELRHKILGF